MKKGIGILKRIGVNNICKKRMKNNEEEEDEEDEFCSRGEKKKNLGNLCSCCGLFVICIRLEVKDGSLVVDQVSRFRDEGSSSCILTDRLDFIRSQERKLVLFLERWATGDWKRERCCWRTSDSA
ncbi:hypothetical protein T05_7047 [Trichinella murrelli]|uniref:Uncharacterized protein n=1 Tax=Trichinella murrelli TaxID=144512 RepID=A0A0V0U9R3_9BILA|nr:hypothetical protein T05_7047 [Trichinella murrelli]